MTNCFLIVVYCFSSENESFLKNRSVIHVPNVQHLQYYGINFIFTEFVVVTIISTASKHYNNITFCECTKQNANNAAT